MLVEQLARPDDFLDAFGDGLAVIAVGFLISAFHGLKRPVGFRHGFDVHDAFGDLDAHFEGGGAFAAMRHARHGLVDCVDRGLALFKRHMGG
jgi:hypothetical protein